MKMITKNLKDNFNSYEKEMLFKDIFAQGIESNTFGELSKWFRNTAVLLKPKFQSQQTKNALEGLKERFKHKILQIFNEEFKFANEAYDNT